MTEPLLVRKTTASGSVLGTTSDRPTSDLEAPLRLTAIDHAVPAILQERFEFITVLECRKAEPAKLTPRQMTRRELLSESIGAQQLASSLHPSRKACAARLSLRDLRRLDPVTSQHSPPTLFVRHGAILLSISRLGVLARSNLNVIIHHDRMLLLTRTPDDACAVAVHRELVRLWCSSLLSSSLPFEFIALESALLQACAEIQLTTNTLSTHVVEEMRQLGAMRSGSAASAMHRRTVRELSQRVQEESALSTALSASLSRAIDSEAASLSSFCLTELASASDWLHASNLLDDDESSDDSPGEGHGSESRGTGSGLLAPRRLAEEAIRLGISVDEYAEYLRVEQEDGQHWDKLAEARRLGMTVWEVYCST